MYIAAFSSPIPEVGSALLMRFAVVVTLIRCVSTTGDRCVTSEKKFNSKSKDLPPDMLLISFCLEAITLVARK